LKTLAQAGYLKEDTSNKTYRYELLQKEPNHLDLLENIRSLNRFHRNSLRKWLNTIETTGHAKHTIIAFYNPTNDSWTQSLPILNDSDKDSENSASPESSALTCLDVHMHSAPESSLELAMGPDCQDSSEMSTFTAAKPRNNQNIGSKSLDDFKVVYWSDGFHDWHDCAVCGYKKLTSWQAETFKDEKLWLCEDCKTAWEKHQENCPA
jgi:hypothetical protein